MQSNTDSLDVFDVDPDSEAAAVLSVVVAALCLLVRDGALPSVIEVRSGVPLALRAGDKGTGVKLYQRALLAAAGQLPRFGADGDFGRETTAAGDKVTGHPFPTPQAWASLFGPQIGFRLIYTEGALTLERFLVDPAGAQVVKETCELDHIQLSKILRSALLDLVPAPVA